MKHRFPISLLIVVFEIIILECYLLCMGFLLSKEDKVMDTAVIIASATAVGVAILGAAAGIWAQFVQFKKDARQIDQTNTSLSSVKTDTTEIKPAVKVIQEDVRKVRESLLERFAPIFEKIDGIDELVEECHTNRRIQELHSRNLLPPSAFKGAIDLLYIENAHLVKENKEYQTRIVLLEVENRSLKDIVEKYEPQTKRRSSPDRSL